MSERENLVDEVGDFAVESWEAFRDGSLTDRKTIEAAKGVLGRLHAYALVEGIEPPQRAISELSEKAEFAARNLLETALRIDAESRRPMHPDTVKRIGRILNHAEERK